MTVVYTRWKFISVSCGPGLCGQATMWCFYVHGVASCAHESSRQLQMSAIMSVFQAAGWRKGVKGDIGRIGAKDTAPYVSITGI